MDLKLTIFRLSQLSKCHRIFLYIFSACLLVWVGFALYLGITRLSKLPGLCMLRANGYALVGQARLIDTRQQAKTSSIAGAPVNCAVGTCFPKKEA